MEHSKNRKESALIQVLIVALITLFIVSPMATMMISEKFFDGADQETYLY